MVTRIVYDTEFIDNGITIEPISIALVRPSDGAELYAINDDLAVIAQAAESNWLRENVLRWLPVDVTLTAGYGAINAHVQWNANHPEYASVRPLSEISGMVDDFLREKPDPQLWAYYASYDHVLYAQLFGAMVDLPDGLPMYTMDLKHEAVMHGDPELPKLPNAMVNSRFGGIPMEHHALYDAHEEAYQLQWLFAQRTLHRGRSE